MSQHNSTTNEFEFSKYLDKLEMDFNNKKDMIIALQENVPALAAEILEILIPHAYDLAGEVKSSLESVEKLATTRNGQTPHLIVDPTKGVISAEILTWAIAILASSWSVWMFNAKSYNPINQEDKDKPEAAINIKFTRPYIRTSLVDAMTLGEEIGKRKKTGYRPDPQNFPLYLKLRKE
jgi:hypothetical protein